LPASACHSDFELHCEHLGQLCRTTSPCPSRCLPASPSLGSTACSTPGDKVVVHINVWNQTDRPEGTHFVRQLLQRLLSLLCSLKSSFKPFPVSSPGKGLQSDMNKHEQSNKRMNRQEWLSASPEEAPSERHLGQQASQQSSRSLDGGCLSGWPVQHATH